MNIFTGDIKVIEKEIEELLNKIHNHNNKSTSMNIFSMLITLIYYYNYITEKESKYVRNLNKNKYFVNKHIIEKNMICNKSIQNFIDNKEIHKNFIEVLMPCDIDIVVSNNDIINDLSIKEEAMYDIIIDFLKSRHSKATDVFKQLIENKKIYKVPIEQEGITISNISSESFHILINSVSDDISKMISLVHELGHVMDDLNIIRNNPIKDAHYYFFKSIFSEVNALKYEKEFMEFLISEGTNKGASIAYLTEFYESIYLDYGNLEVFCNLPDKLLKGEKYLDISEEDLFMELVKESNMSFIDDTCFLQFNRASIIDTLKYGYGRALATYFSYLEKNDTSRYNEEYSKFLKSRVDLFRPDFFGGVVSSEMEILRDIEEEINNSKAKIIIKRN